MSDHTSPKIEAGIEVHLDGIFLLGAENGHVAGTPVGGQLDRIATADGAAMLLVKPDESPGVRRARPGHP